MKIPIIRCEMVREGTQAGAPTRCENPESTAKLLQAYIGPNADREHFVALLLNARNEPIGINTVSIGTLSSSLVHPREVFKPAQLTAAVAAWRPQCPSP